MTDISIFMIYSLKWQIIRPEIIKNQRWFIFYLSDPLQKAKNWFILLKNI